MAGTAILIEVENGVVKETSLGVMTAAAGKNIYALVMGQEVSSIKETLCEYGLQISWRLRFSMGIWPTRILGPRPLQQP